MAIEIGNIVEGTVTGITNFGVFVELPEGKTGMVHISEVADSYVENIHDHLKEKEKILVKIIGIKDKDKYDLSIKQVKNSAEPDQEKGKTKKTKSFVEKSSSSLSFEEKLAKFLKESEERQLDIKRNTEAKRGRGRSNR